ncbi:MAG: response regulator [Asgard group archaeon]|nr:response regulator [Asgard group archaeon]
MIEHLKVLYVEDSENDTVLMNYHLKDLCQNLYHERVETREELQDKLCDKTWDIIIIDNSLPQLTAIDTIKIINELNVEVPMICVSGSEMFDVKDKCLNAGAKAFILKNDSKEFTKVVENILQNVLIKR